VPGALREAFPRKRRSAPRWWTDFAVIHDFGRHVAWLVSTVERHEQKETGFGHYGTFRAAF
jgi:hypothetical protein